MARYFDGRAAAVPRPPTVFMPTLPPLFDLQTLDRLLVGLSDGARRVHRPRLPRARAREDAASG